MSVRAWLLRRVMGRLRISDDIVRHLSTFQRLGETVEVQLPGELLPVGARTVFRAVRTRAAAQLGAGWVWPYWLHRQIDPASPAFIPRGHLPVLTNVTSRNWTAVGSIGSPWEAIVDPRGLVTPWFDGWSLDWWIGADDRWHFPSRETAVRQALVDNAPVVETKLRVPSGDAVERVYGVPGTDPLAVVEIENRSPVPFAVAFAVRPYNPEGLAVVERIELHDRTVTVDGRPALFFPRRPNRVAASTFHDGDVAAELQRGDAGTEMPPGLRCDVGMAQAAFVFPVPHGTSIQVAMPLAPQRRTRRNRVARRRARRTPAVVFPQPTGAEAARGWSAMTDRGMRIVVPDERLMAAVDANRRFLLLFHDGNEITPGPYTYHRFWFRDAAFMLTALDRYGFHTEAAEVIADFPRRQHLDGFFFSQRQEWDANGAALHAMAEHWRLTGDLDVVDAAAVYNGVRWIERKRKAKRRRKDAALVGLLPAGVSAEHLGPFDYFYWDDFWGLRGLLDGAELLRAAGDTEHADQAEAAAADFRHDIDASLRLVRQRLSSSAIPAGPRRRVDSGVIGSLAACWPLRLFDASDDRIVASLDALRAEFCSGPAFYQGISHTGLGTYLTLQLAFVELEAGDRRALERLDWLLGAATTTFTWPEAIHPQLGGGCMGDGHHGWAAADFLSFVRNVLVRDTRDGLELCTVLPPAWIGRPIEVHDAPTHAGQLSFAVRWHDDRPALLWDLRPNRERGDAVRISAPGLDPGWSTIDPKGDALLARPAWLPAADAPPSFA